MSRKPRSDAKLLNLTWETQEQLADRLMDGLSYEKAREWLEAEHGVETSAAALTDFWRMVVAPRRLRRSSAAATSLSELVGTLDIDWEQGTMSLLEQKIFEMLAEPGVDPEAVFFLASTLEKAKGRALKAKELEARISGSQLKFEQKERELKLAQEKFVASLRSKLEQGLAALLEEIRGNPAAVAIFDRLKAEMEAAQPA